MIDALNVQGLTIPYRGGGKSSEKMKKLINLLVISIPESSLVKPDLSHIDDIRNTEHCNMQF